MIKFRRKNISEAGMTMAEFLVVLSILAIVLGAVYAFEANIFIYSNISQTQITNTWQAESVLKPMTKELRGMLPSATGSYPLLTASSTAITFFANIDSDENVEQIRYFIQGSNLYRGQTEPTGNPPQYLSQNESTKILANNVISSSTLPLFQFFDAFYEGTSSPLTYPYNISSIRLVRINLTIDTDPNRAPLIKTFTSSASLRNLKYAL